MTISPTQPLYSIFSLRERVLSISKQLNYYQLSNPQSTFDVLFNAIHATLNSIKFYHIKKKDDTEILAFDSTSMPFIIQNIKGIH